jgi:hypothetical protein
MVFAGCQVVSQTDKGKGFFSHCSTGITVILLPVHDLSKNKRVIRNADFALMSSVCTCGFPSENFESRSELA